MSMERCPHSLFFCDACKRERRIEAAARALRRAEREAHDTEKVKRGTGWIKRAKTYNGQELSCGHEKHWGQGIGPISKQLVCARCLIAEKRKAGLIDDAAWRRAHKELRTAQQKRRRIRRAEEQGKTIRRYRPTSNDLDPSPQEVRINGTTEDDPDLSAY